MFKVNQKVWCAIYGAGVVTEIRHEGTTYPVVAVFNCNDERTVTYTIDGKYYDDGNVTLFPYPVEITKATVKPSIDWSHVSSEFNYLIQDSDGAGYLCSKKPARVEGGWNVESHYICADAFTSYEPGTCDWKDSLVERPN